MASAIDKALAITKTRTYRQMRDFLLWRREGLLQSKCTTTEQLWKVWGAIEEVSLLLTDPLLMAQMMAESQEPEAQEKLHATNLPDAPWVLSRQQTGDYLA